MIKLEAWDAFYTFTKPSPVSYTDRVQHTLSGNVYLVDSLFCDFSVSIPGGAISSSDSNSNILIEKSSFLRTTTSDIAAAIHLDVSNKVCSCFNSDNGRV